MIKTYVKAIAGASALAISLVGAANAETEISVDIDYDAAQLTTSVGAEAVLGSISRQAVQECRTVSLLTGGYHRDEICELDVIHKAVNQIGATELASAYEGSEFFIDAPVTGLVLASN